MSLHPTWHLHSRSHKCCATGTPFTEGQTFYTALFPDPHSSGYLRQDYSLEAWKERAPGSPKPFSYWKTSYKPPVKEEKTEIAPGDNPEFLLRRLIEEDVEHTENTRYILALMLERSKILRETDAQRTPNSLLRVYEHRKSGEIFIIRDPLISLAEAEIIQNEVQAILEKNTLDNASSPNAASTFSPLNQGDSTATPAQSDSTDNANQEI